MTAQLEPTAVVLLGATERTADDDLDAQLMAGVKRGDRDAFGCLVERWKDPLVRYLARLTGQLDSAEDLAQEAFLRLYRSAAGYREQGRLAPYLFRIATNLLRSQERRRRRWRLLEPLVRSASHDEEVAAGERHVLAGELQRQVQRHLAALPMHYRSALVLFEIEGWSQEAIAELLGCRPGTVKSRIHRARALLRDALEPYWNGGAS